MIIDYQNCIVNLSCSILKYFGAEYKHSTLKVIDTLLENTYKNVVVLLLDGLGMDALQYHLDESGYFRTHLIYEYLSVFPPTTIGDDFLLYSKREVINQNLFGMGEMHPKFEEFIGDYLAIAISDKGIVYSQKSNQFLSNHAGMTDKEMKIPIIAITKK